MHVPFLGNAFRRTEQSLERTELVIFITPTLISGKEMDMDTDEYMGLDKMLPGFKIGTVEPVKEGIKNELKMK